MLGKALYEDALFQQYMSSRGFLEVNKHDRYVLEDYEEFLDERKRLMPNYVELLKILNIDFDKETTVEVGKGNLDSVVIPYEATIVTPYKGLFEARKGKVIEGKPMVIDDDIEVIYKYSMANGRETKKLDIQEGRIYMTQNLYGPQGVRNWFHLIPKNDIVVGVFGLRQDKDMNEKIDAIYKVADLIEGSKLSMGEVDDGYYCAMRSTGKEKQLVKEKTYERVR